jgi:hypothetical protein
MFNDYEIEDYENEVEKIQQLTSQLKKTPIKLDEIKVNQSVVINFYPNSQRYIYILTPKYGKVVQVSDSDNVFDYKIVSYNSKSESESEYLFHTGVSYFGDSLGYDYSINLVEP